jgi:asparagine synthase (glutamine-hydrolysing)
MHLKIRGTQQKSILKDVAARWLPAPVINHRKQGFEAPMGRWLRGPLKSLMQDTLTRASLQRGGILDPAQVERLQAEHLAGVRKHSKLLFSLLMFQLWQGSESRRGQSRQAAVTFAA